MQAYHLKTTVEQDGRLTLSDLPLKAGADVEVIILVQSPAPSRQDRYPLQGTPITYVNPTEPVAEMDWSVQP